MLIGTFALYVLNNIRYQVTVKPILLGVFWWRGGMGH